MQCHKSTSNQFTKEDTVSLCAHTICKSLSWLQISALDWHYQVNRQRTSSVALQVSCQVNIPHTFSRGDRDAAIEKMILFSLLRHTKSAASKLFVRTSGMYAAAQMISSSQTLSLLFLSNSIMGNGSCAGLWARKRQTGNLNHALAKEQENWFPLLPLTLSTKQCKSTKFSNSSGWRTREKPRKKIKTESVSSTDGKVSVYKRQRKCTLTWMNSSTLTTRSSHPLKHITCSTTNLLSQIALTHNQPVTVTTKTAR